MKGADMATGPRQSGWTPTTVRRGVCLDLAGGLSTKQVSDKYGISQRTAQRIWLRAKQESPTAEVAQPGGDWRAKLVGKSIVAVERGLEDPTDAYRSASVGVATLKGLGAFAPDPSNVVAVWLAAAPKDWKAAHPVDVEGSEE